MTYKLHRLAAGNYDLILDGVVVGSVVRSTRSRSAPPRWRAEFAQERETWPSPFTEAEHEFGSLEEITDWLGASLVVGQPPRRE